MWWEQSQVKIRYGEEMWWWFYERIRRERKLHAWQKAQRSQLVRCERWNLDKSQRSDNSFTPYSLRLRPSPVLYLQATPLPSSLASARIVLRVFSSSKSSSRRIQNASRTLSTTMSAQTIWKDSSLEKLIVNCIWVGWLVGWLVVGCLVRSISGCLNFTYLLLEWHRPRFLMGLFLLLLLLLLFCVVR